VSLSLRRASVDTVSSMVALVAPALASLVFVPRLLDQLGTAGFGVLAIAWALLGYFSIFELGLSRALTLVIAEMIGSSHATEPRRMGLRGVVLLAALGMGGTLVTLALGAATLTFWSAGSDTHGWLVVLLVAAAVPAVTVFSGCRGVLEANNAFTGSNTIRGLVGVASYAAPSWAASQVETGLTGAVGALVLVRVIGMVAMLLLARRYLSGTPAEHRPLRHDFQRLFSYGKWITVSNMVGPVMINMDRLIVGWTLGATAAGLYAAPQDLLSRASSFSGALTSVLFPHLAKFRARRLTRLSDRVLTNAWDVVAYPTIAGFTLLIAAMPALIQMWLPAHADASMIHTAQILAGGAMANTLAQLPAVDLQSGGRPDLNAKLHLAEVIPFAAATAVLSLLLGIEGAALAWSLRAVLDCLGLVVLSKKTAARARIRNRMIGVVVVGLACCGAAALPMPPWALLALCAVVVAVCGTRAVAALSGLRK